MAPAPNDSPAGQMKVDEITGGAPYGATTPLAEAVRTLYELLEQSASGARESDAEGGPPS